MILVQATSNVANAVSASRVVKGGGGGVHIGGNGTH